MRDLGNYFVVLKQKLSDFFRNRKRKLIYVRELIFQHPSCIYRYALDFLLDLGISFNNNVKVTIAGATLQINQFYLSSCSETFRNGKGKLMFELKQGG